MQLAFFSYYSTGFNLRGLEDYNEFPFHSPLGCDQLMYLCLLPPTICSGTFISASLNESRVIFLPGFREKLCGSTSWLFVSRAPKRGGVGWQVGTEEAKGWVGVMVSVLCSGDSLTSCSMLEKPGRGPQKTHG